MAPQKLVSWQRLLLLAAVLLLLGAPLSEAVYRGCKYPSTKYLEANKDTVKWGYYDLDAPFVHSGDTITIEVLTHTAGGDYSKMIKGDPGVESVYEWKKGASYASKASPQYADSGPHIVTGPIEVCGAEPGDVEIKTIVPRKNPSTGKTYGCNVMAPFGYHFTSGGHADGKPFTQAEPATITMYEIVYDKSDKEYYGQPIYQYKQPTILTRGGFVTAADDQPIGVVAPHAYDVGGTNKKVTYGRNMKTLLGPEQSKITYTNATLDFRVPLRPHLGIMAVMPANGQKFLNGAPAGTEGCNTIPPSKFGGNIDNWRVGPGTTMYYKVELPGARFVVADTHASQGDGEVSGTAIETHMTATLKITLIKQEYFVHGFAYSDYLEQLAVPNNIFPGNTQTGSNLDKAMKGAYNQTLNFLMSSFLLQEAEAIGLMSTAIDFFVTQVVDGNWGVHGVIRKELFVKRTKGRKLLEYMGNQDLIDQLSHRARLAARRRNSAIADLWS
eukprot:jgi/Mesen1/8265/ME000448S07414